MSSGSSGRQLHVQDAYWHRLALQVCPLWFQPPCTSRAFWVSWRSILEETSSLRGTGCTAPTAEQPLTAWKVYKCFLGCPVNTICKQVKLKQTSLSQCSCHLLKIIMLSLSSLTQPIKRQVETRRILSHTCTSTLAHWGQCRWQLKQNVLHGLNTYIFITQNKRSLSIIYICAFSEQI